jgi:hypothetical protein
VINSSGVADKTAAWVRKAKVIKVLKVCDIVK